MQTAFLNEFSWFFSANISPKFVRYGSTDGTQSWIQLILSSDNKPWHEPKMTDIYVGTWIMICGLFGTRPLSARHDFVNYPRIMQFHTRNYEKITYLSNW